MPPRVATLLRGFAEGGVAALFAFWLADLIKRRSSNWQEWAGVSALGTLVAIFALMLAQNATTPPRPFTALPILTPAALLFALLLGVGALLQASWQRNLTGMLLFAAGLLLFATLAGEPLREAGLLQFSKTPLVQGVAQVVSQVRVAWLYYLTAQTLSKLPFVMLPLALHLIEWHTPIKSVASLPDNT